MDDPLLTIKRCAMARRVEFTHKARLEMDADDLTPTEVLESLVLAPGIYKVLKSRSPDRASRREELYVIRSFSLSLVPIYTKGKIVDRGGEPVFYVLVSSKLDLDRRRR